jgi:hypothetical protein
MIDTFDSDYLKLKELAAESTEPIKIEPWVLKSLIDEVDRLGREYEQDTMMYHGMWFSAGVKLTKIKRALEMFRCDGYNSPMETEVFIEVLSDILRGEQG